MGKSARVLGWEFGLKAAEMNRLLKKHGYLYGSPGAYGLTEKGERYAEEQYHTRGTGGYSHYNRQWETRTWSDETAAALRADMEANPDGVEDYTPVAEEAFRYEPLSDVGDGRGDGNGRRPGWPELAVGGAVAGVLFLAPRVKRLWDGRLKPAAQRLLAGPTKQEPADPAG